MKSLWIVIGTLLLLGGAGLLLLRREATAAAPKRSSVDEAAITDEVASLRREVAALRDRPSHPPLPIVPAAEAGSEAPAPAAPPPAAELTFEQKAARFEQEVEAMAFALDQRLATEGRDPVWSVDSQRNIDSTLKERVPGATLVESSCSTNLCRATLQQASLEDQSALSGAIANSPPFDQGTFYRYDRTASPPRTTLYVVRAGHNLGELTGLTISGAAAN